MPESRRHFSRRVDKALDNPSLQQALTSGLTGIRARRDRAFESFDFEKGRAELKQRRRANLDDLPELADQFKQRMEAAGGVVHYAKDAAEARKIIGQMLAIVCEPSKFLITIFALRIFTGASRVIFSERTLHSIGLLLLLLCNLVRFVCERIQASRRCLVLHAREQALRFAQTVGRAKRIRVVLLLFR